MPNETLGLYSMPLSNVKTTPGNEIASFSDQVMVVCTQGYTLNADCSYQHN